MHNSAIRTCLFLLPSICSSRLSSGLHTKHNSTTWRRALEVDTTGIRMLPRYPWLLLLPLCFGWQTSEWLRIKYMKSLFFNIEPRGFSTALDKKSLLPFLPNTYFCQSSIPLSFGQALEQLVQRIYFTWPRPCLARPLLRLFCVMFGYPETA